MFHQHQNFDPYNFVTPAKILLTHTTHGTHAKVWFTWPTNPRTQVTYATHVV